MRNWTSTTEGLGRNTEIDTWGGSYGRLMTPLGLSRFSDLLLYRSWMTLFNATDGFFERHLKSAARS